MNKASCEVIRGLLPLYEDGAANQETQDMVQEHLKDCPACREELRKMRTPLSVPPEQDGELWERYAEKQDKLRQKRRKRIAAAAAVVAVIALFCLWYTRPQKLLEVLGVGEPANLAGSVSDMTPVIDENGYVNSSIASWTLNGVEAGDPAMEEILSALENATCQASLRSLIPRGSTYTSESSGFLLMGIVWEDGSYSSFDLASNGELIIGSDIGLDIYKCSPALFDALAAAIQTYGISSKE